ncbi:MAG: preprotein translocase subunit YajC [Alphaproteobacteria bacterium]|nr:preprotein translocase subunit YajC [Alphaproteobacteria bacterium]
MPEFFTQTSAPDPGTLVLAQASSPPQGDLLSTLPMLIIIFGIFYFLVIRPQNKAREEHKTMLAALKKGDRVVTDGGIIGVVQQVESDQVEIEVAPKIRMTFLTESVKGRLGDQEAS